MYIDSLPSILMYPDFGYKRAHAQSVCTRPFLPRREGPGDEARIITDEMHPYMLLLENKIWGTSCLLLSLLLLFVYFLALYHPYLLLQFICLVAFYTC